MQTVPPGRFHRQSLIQQHTMSPPNHLWVKVFRGNPDERFGPDETTCARSRPLTVGTYLQGSAITIPNSSATLCRFPTASLPAHRVTRIHVYFGPYP